MCMSVPPNLSVLSEVYQLLYGFGICLGIRQVYVLFWAFSWFLIPPCQCAVAGFNIYWLCLRMCHSPVQRQQCRPRSCVLKKFHYFLILKKWASNNNGRCFIHPALRTLIKNLCRAEKVFCFKVPPQKRFQSFVWWGRGLLSWYSFSCLELTFIPMIFLILS